MEIIIGIDLGSSTSLLVIDDWILATGFWRDEGLWRDNKLWID